MTNIIETTGLVKCFGAQRALDGIDVIVPAGSPIGLVGPNGAGKTTFFSVICGFLSPDSGMVNVLGHKPGSAHNRYKVSVLPQDAQLHKSVPILSQLTFFARLHGNSASQARAEAQEVLDTVNLKEAMHKTPQQLSHGMYKRALIARALLGNPELILFDEPTAGLDPNTAARIREIIRERCKNATFVISSHNLGEIEDLCESVLVIDKGRVIKHEQIQAIVARSSSLTVRLEDEAPANIEQLLSELTNITKVVVPQAGARQMIIHYQESGDTPMEVSVIQCLSKHKIAYREIARGTSLAKQVADMTAPDRH